MTPNRPAAHTGFTVPRNNGRWHDDLPDPERDDTEAEGLPLPAWADGFSIPRPRQEVRR